MEREKNLNRNYTRQNNTQKTKKHDVSELKSFIQLSLRDIKEQESPKELNEIRKFFRKQVPLSLRSYFAAYLLKHGDFSAVTKANSQKKQYKRLFLNAGRQHNMTAKMIKDLFSKVRGMQRTDIGNISIHNMFSFVDVTAAFADIAISELMGFELDKKRKLVINFAKKKR